MPVYFVQAGEVRKIPLSNSDFVALIDESDYELVSARPWFAKRDKLTIYARTTGSIYLHRFILVPPVGARVDHRNGNGLDCRRANLRLATNSQNSANRRLQRRRLGMFKGVCLNEGRWQARIGSRPTVHLGRFDDPIAAALAYDAAARARWGEFAHVNFPNGVVA